MDYLQLCFEILKKKNFCLRLKVFPLLKASVKNPQSFTSKKQHKKNFCSIYSGTNIHIQTEKDSRNVFLFFVHSQGRTLWEYFPLMSAFDSFVISSQSLPLKHNFWSVADFFVWKVKALHMKASLFVFFRILLIRDQWASTNSTIKGVITEFIRIWR